VSLPKGFCRTDAEKGLEISPQNYVRFGMIAALNAVQADTDRIDFDTSQERRKNYREANFEKQRKERPEHPPLMRSPR
jgi:hypothetical protein